MVSCGSRSGGTRRQGALFVESRLGDCGEVGALFCRFVAQYDGSGGWSGLRRRRQGRNNVGREVVVTMWEGQGRVEAHCSPGGCGILGLDGWLSRGGVGWESTMDQSGVLQSENAERSWL